MVFGGELAKRDAASRQKLRAISRPQLGQIEDSIASNVFQETGMLVTAFDELIDLLSQILDIAPVESVRRWQEELKNAKLYLKSELKARHSLTLALLIKNKPPGKMRSLPFSWFPLRFTKCSL